MQDDFAGSGSLRLYGCHPGDHQMSERVTGLLEQDAAPSKQGKFLPGSHIPVFSPTAIADKQPDFVLILPWNLRTEVMAQLSYIKEWGGRFITAVPDLQIC